MPLYYAQQYITKTLNGAIDASQTTGITLSNTTGIDTSVAGIVAISWSDPLNTTNVEWVSYTSINGSGVLQGVTRGVEGSTGKAHTNGSVVAFPLSKSHINNINTAFVAQHNEDGTHKNLSLTAYSGLSLPEGTLLNGKIVPSVASNNLTVALKTAAGTDASATDPIYVKIGDTVRSITGALSITRNAGTNWFNSGSSELATKEVDYFVYLGYNATDGVVIGFSRIPYVSQYDGFNTTNTNPKHAAISTITNAAATDRYVNIGRFAASLTATATFNWSVPTFNANNLVQRPIFDTRWLSYTPTLGATGSMTYGTTTVNYAKYRLDINSADVQVDFTGTTGGSASNSLTWTLPIPIINTSVNTPSGFCNLADGGNQLAGYVVYSNTTTLLSRRYDGANFGLGSNRYSTSNIRYEY